MRVPLSWIAEDSKVHDWSSGLYPGYPENFGTQRRRPLLALLWGGELGIFILTCIPMCDDAVYWGGSVLWEQLRIHFLNFSFPHSPGSPCIIQSLFQLGRAVEIWKQLLSGVLPKPSRCLLINCWQWVWGLFVLWVLVDIISWYGILSVCGSPNPRVGTPLKSVVLQQWQICLNKRSRWELFVSFLLSHFSTPYSKRNHRQDSVKIFHLGRYKLCHTSCSHELGNTFFCPCGCLPSRKCWPKAHSVMGQSFIRADIRS